MRLFAASCVAVLALFFSSFASATAVKVMVEWPTVVDLNNDGNDDCVMTSDDDVNKLPKDSPAALGTATGDCANAWTSGVNFQYGHRGIRTGRTSEGCLKTVYYHSNVNTTTGGPGMFSTWVAQSPVSCFIGDKRYHMYDAVKP
jgi:hypothetical protein